MSTTPPSPAAINEKNRVFWEQQNALLSEQVQDPYLLQVVMHDMKNEEQRGVPLRNRKSMPQAFADAASIQKHVEEEIEKSYRTEFARKGGQAEKDRPSAKAHYRYRASEA